MQLSQSCHLKQKSAYWRRTSTSQQIPSFHLSFLSSFLSLSSSFLPSFLPNSTKLWRVPFYSTALCWPWIATAFQSAGLGVVPWWSPNGTPGGPLMVPWWSPNGTLVRDGTQKMCTLPLKEMSCRPLWISAMQIKWTWPSHLLCILVVEVKDFPVDPCAVVCREWADTTSIYTISYTDLV